MTDNNRRQARIPEGAIAVENPAGTAPAFIVEDERGIIICLPGVPRELQYLMERRVVPYLRERMGEASVIKAKVLRTCAIGESQIDALIGDLMSGGNPTVGLAAHSGQVDVRITAKAADEAEADQLIAPVEAELRARLGNVIYGQGTEALEEVVAQILTERGMRLSVIDGATGGEIAHRLENTSQADVLVSKQDLAGENGLSALRSQGLRPEVVAPGPQAITEQLAARARAYSASLGLAIFDTTRQEEGGRSRAFLSLNDGSQAVTRAFDFGGESKLTRRWLSTRALDLVRRYLIDALDEEMD
jgi:nicotinamide-nucleotide amidase